MLHLYFVTFQVLFMFWKYKLWKLKEMLHDQQL